jgi:hypothetical protein
MGGIELTSGIPFSREEIEYVRQHSPREFPSVIARGLAMKFRDYNGGYRSKDGVANLMQKIWSGSLESDRAEPVIVVQEEEKKKLPDLRKGKKGIRKKE